MYEFVCKCVSMWERDRDREKRREKIENEGGKIVRRKRNKLRRKNSPLSNTFLHQFSLFLDSVNRISVFVCVSILVKDLNLFMNLPYC